MIRFTVSAEPRRPAEQAQVGEPIDRTVHGRIGLAPQAPALFRAQPGDRARQMIGRIPVIEFLP